MCMLRFLPASEVLLSKCQMIITNILRLKIDHFYKYVLYIHFIYFQTKYLGQHPSDGRSYRSTNKSLRATLAFTIESNGIHYSI